MKLKKIFALLLVLTLSFSLFSCDLVDKIMDFLPFTGKAEEAEQTPQKGPDDYESENETEATDYYADFLDTAERNAATGEFTLEVCPEDKISELDVDGAVNVFFFANSDYSAVTYVYKFTSKESANAFYEMLLEDYAGYSDITTKIFDDAVIFGYTETVERLVNGEVYEPLDYSEYRDTRDVEGRETVTVKIVVRDYGDIVLLLDATTAPVTVANFTKLVSEGFYDGLTFHRVIKDFMIQGGDPLANGTGGSDEKIYGEFSSNGHDNDIQHLRGTISMARSNDPDSASSQFFICNADAPHLDGSYAAFGYVISGMSVVDAITRETAKHGDYNGAIAIKTNQAVIETIEILP